MRSAANTISAAAVTVLTAQGKLNCESGGAPPTDLRLFATL